MSGNGNIREDRPKAQPVEEFHEGDLVRLTEASLRDKRKGIVFSSPRRLISVGWPNVFQVMKVVEFEEEGLCLSLSACCYNMIDRSGERLCTAHPARLFQKLDLRSELEAVRPRQKGDKSAVLVTPFGELFAAEYREDPENPHFHVRLASLPIDLEGGLAKWVKDLFTENGIFPKSPS